MNVAPQVLGIITARGASKSIPRKNIVPILGKPLIAYTIDAAKKSTLLSRTILSTDDTEIAAIARDLGCEVPFMRPAPLANDESTSVEVVKHALDWIERHENNRYDYVLILQPTSPLRTAQDIDTSIRIAIEKNADSVLGMKELDDMSIQKLKVLTFDGEIRPLVEEEGLTSSRRQDLPTVYRRNAAIYLTKTEIIRSGDLFGTKSYAHVMPEERSVDINRPVDIALAEFFLSQNR